MNMETHVFLGILKQLGCDKTIFFDIRMGLWKSED
ncbi:hypothetical protein E2C01_053738 [Portunus trituberculatus]|uniref:Uncharacterized protein n=1 Tax=Portunus trituberculatus TaxID=210409 RepID=A0A5B7GHZ5_PORTR|nr:hypothetical protein [Portunus trituberculatus]